MPGRPPESACIAVIDAIVSMGMAEDGSVGRQELERTALRREEFAKAALSRYAQDYPAPSGEGETYNAIGEGLLLLAADTVSWLLDHGNLTEAGPDQVRPGKPLKIDGKLYSPGSAREEDLFHSIRRVTPKRLELIRQSMADLGDLSEFFPILRDAEGNVVDGRHRLAINENWPAMKIRVPMDMRVAASVAANRSNAWSPEDWHRLMHHRQQSVGRRQAVRTIARLALLEDAERSNAVIARMTGVDDKTIAKVRAGLEETSEIPRFATEGGRPRSDGSPAQPRPETEADRERLVAGAVDGLQRGLNQREIGEELGLADNSMKLGAAVAVARERLAQRTVPEHTPSGDAFDKVVAGLENPVMPPVLVPEPVHQHGAQCSCGLWLTQP